MSSYFTAFPTVENPLSEGGLWLAGGVVGLDWQNPYVPSAGLVRAPDGGSVDAAAILDPAHFTFANDQWAWGKVVNNIASGYNEVDIELRCAMSANWYTGYDICATMEPAGGGPWADVSVCARLGIASPDEEAYAAIGNLANSARWVTGDKLAVKITGWVIEVFKNGASMGTVTDTTHYYAGGMPGLAAGESASHASGFSMWKAGEGAIDYAESGPPAGVDHIRRPLVHSQRA